MYIPNAIAKYPVFLAERVPVEEHNAPEKEQKIL